MSHVNDHDPDRNDIDIDARLRRALVHAPDAEIQPPVALDQTILRAAHVALQKPGVRAAANQPSGLFARLKRWWAQPAAAPAFAVLALSAVIVSMWTRHGVPPPTSDDDAKPVARAPTPELAKAPRPAVVGRDEATTPSSASAVTKNAAATAPSGSTAESVAAPIVEARGGTLAEMARMEGKTPSSVPPQKPASPTMNQTRRDSAQLQAPADKKADPTPPPKEAGARARQQAAAAPRGPELDEFVAAPEALRDAASAPAPPGCTCGCSPARGCQIRSHEIGRLGRRPIRGHGAQP